MTEEAKAKCEKKAMVVHVAKYKAHMKMLVPSGGSGLGLRG